MSIKTFGVKPAMFYEDPEGAWVREEDHAAEVERWKAFYREVVSDNRAKAQEVERLTGELADLTEILSYRDRDIGKFRKGVVALTTEIVELKRDLAAARAEADTHHDALGTCADSHEEQRQELMKARAERDGLADALRLALRGKPVRNVGELLAALPTPPEQDGDER